MTQGAAPQWKGALVPYTAPKTGHGGRHSAGVTGNNGGLQVLEQFSDAGLDYVEIDYVLGKTEALWKQIEKVLLDAAAERRMKRKPRGRPKAGPGSGILRDASGPRTSEERLAEVTEVYERLAEIERPVSYIALAAALDLSIYTLYRIRKQLGWSPPDTKFP